MSPTPLRNLGLELLRTPFPRRRVNVCNGSVMYGKLVALQCPLGQQNDSGALRTGW
jgi:hypothetical protein